MKNFNHRDTTIFNSPLEIGLRTLFLLSASAKSCDLQRLVYYDYLLVHSGDIKNGPESIHPNIPYRASEILVKRELLKGGLNLMISRELVKLNFTSTGIAYEASDLTLEFLKYLDSDYAKELSSVAIWVIDYFENLTDRELELYIKDKLDVWGGEFTKESLLRGEQNI